MQSLGAKTILFPTPVLLVGSYDMRGIPNLMAVAWGGICCSKPPCIAISLREATYTDSNIKWHQAFTVAIPSAAQVRDADYIGIYSGRDENKFETLGLTAVKSELVDAPYAKEFPLVLECKVLHTIPIGLHTQFIGEILDVKADMRILNHRKEIDVMKLDPMIYSTTERAYRRFGEKVGDAYTIGLKRTAEPGIE